MRRLLHLAARLYPGAWRKRYGVEFGALLDDLEPGWRDVVDVLWGGLRMHLRLIHPAAMAALVGLVGACLAGGVAVSTANRFVSRGTINIQRAGQSPAQLTAAPDEVILGMAENAFDQNTLRGLIETYDLYPGTAPQSSAGAAAEGMRGDIGIQRVSPGVIQVSFVASDGRKAQRVVQELMTGLVRANLERSGGFASGGFVFQVVGPPDEPQVSISSRRVTLAVIGGFGGGAVIGTLIGLFRRRGSGYESSADHV